MIIRILLLYSFLFVSCSGKSQQKSDPPAENSTEQVTTYILVRHAEKESQSSTAELTEEGFNRANNLAGFLEPYKIDYVYSTNVTRTEQTATPTAKKNNLTLINYIPGSLYTDDFKQKTKGKSTLIVGHSNTIPDLVNKIIGKNKYSDINDSDFNNVYIVEIKGEEITETLKNID